MYRIISGFILVLLIIIHNSSTIYATVDDTNVDIDVEDYSFDELSDKLEEYSLGINLDIDELFKNLIKGDTTSSFKNFFDKLIDNLTWEIKANKSIAIQIIIICIIAAIFTNFSSCFNNKQISSIGFYVTYLVLFILTITSFYIINSVATGIVNGILDFVAVLIPTYFLSVGVACGSVTALAMYETTLFFIGIVNVVFLNIIIPLITVYLIISMINNLLEEDKLSKLAELIKTIIEWSLKTLVVVLLGLSTIQSLMLPSVDNTINGGTQKLINMLPGIGNGANTLINLALGSAVLVKNAIGIIGIIAIVIMCIIPIIKMLVFSMIFKITAAIIEPISDTRVINLIEAISNSAVMLMKVVFASIIMFVSVLAIICITTNIRV